MVGELQAGALALCIALGVWAGHARGGEFGYAGASGDAGQLKCTDGASPAFRFQRLGLMSAYGTGSSGPGALSFTYGLSAEDSAPCLELPPGKELRGEGERLELVVAVPFPQR